MSKNETPDIALPFSDVWRQMEFEIERLRTENETLRRDVRTAVMGDSAELADVKRENEKLRVENDILKDLCKGKWEQIKDAIRESGDE